MEPPAALGEYLYHGTHCVCVALTLVPGRRMLRYAVVSRIDGQTVAELRWHPQKGQYVFIPGANTAWTSRDLAEVGLWMRRLLRVASEEE